MSEMDHLTERVMCKLLGEELEAHILNFYEDLDMPLGDLYEIIDAIRDGKLEDVTEKMDGINITFTVIDGELRFFSKGPSWVTVQKGGLNRDTINVRYQSNPGLRDAFLLAYDTLLTVIKRDQETADRLLQGGQVVVESAVMVPSAQNTVVYEEPHIRFITAAAVGPDAKVDRSAYATFIKTAEAVSADMAKKVGMGAVPLLKLKRSLDSSDEITGLKSHLDSLLSSVKMKKDSTVGDYALKVVEQKLDQLGFPAKLKAKAAARLVTGDKTHLTKSDAMKLVGPDAWRSFQALEDTRSDLVADAIIPLEKIIQLMGAYAFKNLDFALASNSKESGEEMRRFVKDVRNAFSQGKIIADPEQLARIKTSLDRIGDNEDMFEKAVEGIVFRWKGKTRKLTGLFTPINKLRGFFYYGKVPASITEKNDVLRQTIRFIMRDQHGR